MAMRQGGRVHRGPRRKSLWLQFQPTVSTVTGSGDANLVFTLNSAALALRPFTVVRTHFQVMIRSDQEAAMEQQIGAFGIAVVSDEAVAVGITAIPTPAAQLGSGLWFVNQLCFGEESRLADKALPPMHYQIDSKAMRKVEAGSDIVVVVETVFSPGIVFTLGGRILVKTN